VSEGSCLSNNHDPSESLWIGGAIGLFILICLLVAIRKIYQIMRRQNKSAPPKPVVVIKPSAKTQQSKKPVGTSPTTIATKNTAPLNNGQPKLNNTGLRKEGKNSNKAPKVIPPPIRSPSPQFANQGPIYNPSAPNAMQPPGYNSSPKNVQNSNRPPPQNLIGSPQNYAPNYAPQLPQNINLDKPYQPLEPAKPVNNNNYQNYGMNTQINSGTYGTSEAAPPLSQYQIDSLQTSTVGINTEFSDIFLQETLCSVCNFKYGAGERVASLPCGHVLHASCAQVRLQFSGMCPQCKKPIV
jgi:hypothetical protein